MAILLSYQTTLIGAATGTRHVLVVDVADSGWENPWAAIYVRRGLRRRRLPETLERAMGDALATRTADELLLFNDDQRADARAARSLYSL